MGMELKVTIELGDGDSYPRQLEVSRKFEVNLPWAPGNHNAETALVEAISTVVNFGEVIGELHEELTKAYDEKLEKLERQRLEEEKANDEQETMTVQAQDLHTQSGEAHATADAGLEARQ